MSIRCSHLAIALGAALSSSALFGLTTRLAAQTTGIDPALMAEIRRIRAIDNHSHPPRLIAQGEKDDEFDALP